MLYFIPENYYILKPFGNRLAINRLFGTVEMVVFFKCFFYLKIFFKKLFDLKIFKINFNLK
jgi:hypothetical protein